MNSYVEMLPAYRIAYIRRRGPYGPANIDVMERLKKWAREQSLLESSILFAIPQDHPETTPPDNCRFDACIVIPTDFQVDDPVTEGKIAGGKYLICEVNHTAEDIQKAYAEIIPYLLSNGYQIENKPIMEKYKNDIDSSPFCEICVPIK